MITFLSRKHIRYDELGRDVVRVAIAVSSSLDLPTKYSIDGVVIAESSKAWDISTGDQYGFLDASGWTKQPGSMSGDFVSIKGRVDTVNDLPSNAEEGWLYFVGLSTDPDLDEYVYTADNKWERIGSTAITVDSALSTTSENPVQNKVITGALNGLGALAHKDSASTTFTPTLTTSVSNGTLTVSFSQDTITVT